jgi:hypothetical protein
LCAAAQAAIGMGRTRRHTVAARRTTGRFFYFDQTEKGPPFGIDAKSLNGLLSKNFELLENVVPKDSIAVFEGKEKWQVWQRH